MRGYPEFPPPSYGRSEHIGDPTVWYLPAYPRKDARPLRGLRRFRFVCALLADGFPSVRFFQRAAEITVDGKVGPQTWVAFYARGDR